MTNEQLQDIYNKLNAVDTTGVLANGFLNSKDKYKYLRDIEPTLEGSSSYTDVYDNLDDFIGDRNTRLAKFYTSLKGNIPSESRINSFLNKNSDISKEDVLNWFNKTNEYKEYYKQERKKGADKVSRQQEVKDWGWRDFIASDYEKQRYIEDPQSALFGKQAPGIGAAPETRWGSMGDLGAGVVAGTTDLVTAPFPIVNVLAGPTVRLGRDVAHKASGSPYQKDLKDIGSNYLSDIMLNGGASVLANARRASRVVGGLLPGSTNKQFQALVDAKESVEALKKLPPTSNTWEFVNAVDNLEESSLKQDLLKTISPNGKVDVAAANAVRKNYNVALDKQYFNDLRTHTPGYYETAPATTIEEQLRNNVLKDASNTSLGQRLGRAGTPNTRIERIALGGLNLMDKLNRGTLGTRFVEGTANLTGRGTAPKVINTEEQIEDFETKKNQYRQSEARFWSAGFRPNKMDGDPLWEAYKEWYQDTYGRDVEDK